MNQPRIFISGVSEELRSVRLMVRDTVRLLGFEPVSQDDFPTGHGELLAWLREQLDSCEGLIQLVGEAYGAEPPTVPPPYDRLSYTQFEFRYAFDHGKKTWVIVAGPNCKRDKPVDQIDLPRDPTHPDAAGYQAERRELQSKYVSFLRQQNHLRHTANDDKDIKLIIQGIDDKLAALRNRSVRQLRRLNMAIGVILLGLAGLGAGGWFAYRRLHQDVQHSGAVTTEGTTDHLVSVITPIREETRRTAASVAHADATISEIRTSATQTSEKMVQLNATMTMATAQATLQSAINARDGALSGQVEAMETLIALGHTFTGADFSGVSLQGAKLPRADFSSAKLHAINLANVRATEADFSQAGLRFATLQNGQFQGAKFCEAYAPFTQAQNAVMTRADLREANFTCSNFQDADFRGSKLCGACFAFADLRGANFDGADLTGTYLIGSILDRATFTNAIVVDTDVYGACDDTFPFSASQAVGLCRPAVHVLQNGLKVDRPTMKWDVRAMEQWKSDKYDTGFDFWDLKIPTGWNIADFCDPGLPPRKTEPQELPAAFFVDEPGEMIIHLDREYLEKAGREKRFVQLINQHRTLLLEQLKPERMLRLPKAK